MTISRLFCCCTTSTAAVAPNNLPIETGTKALARPDTTTLDANDLRKAGISTKITVPALNIAKLNANPLTATASKKANDLFEPPISPPIRLQWNLEREDTNPGPAAQFQTSTKNEESPKARVPEPSPRSSSSRPLGHRRCLSLDEKRALTLARLILLKSTRLVEDAMLETPFHVPENSYLRSHTNPATLDIINQLSVPLRHFPPDRRLQPIQLPIEHVTSRSYSPRR